VLPESVESATRVPVAAPRTLFHIDDVVAQVHPTPTTWLVVGGSNPSTQGDAGQELTFAGAVRIAGQWRQTVRAHYAITEDAPDSCNAARKRLTGPTGPTLVVVCWNGGSDGEHFVLALGDSANSPRVLYSIDCGETGFSVRSGVLSIQSWELSGGLGAGPPPPRNPTFELRWDATQGGRFVRMGSVDGVPSYCVTIHSGGNDSIVCGNNSC
jgi:hypothetical protein